MTTSLTTAVRLTALALVAALACVLAVPSTADAATANDRGAAAIFTATNKYRTDGGLKPLMRDGGIDAVAQKWARQMLDRGVLSHNPNYGDQMPKQGRTAWGENVAYACGYGGVAANVAVMMRGWWNSPGHRANMMTPGFTHIGIGFAYSSASDCAYAVQNFGKYSGTFVDVPASHQFSTQIEWMVDRKITTGFADGRFKPSIAVTREGFAAFLYRLAGRPAVTLPATSPFEDVPKSAQFYKEIVWLSKQGITSGYADGTFRPDSKISREAIAAFLYRAAGKPAVTMPKSSPFKDVSLTHKFAREIVWLSKSGITTGYADDTFRPYDPATRAATAAFLYRAKSRLFT